MKTHFTAGAVGLWLFASGAAAQFTYTVSFATPTVDPYFHLVRTDSGFTGAQTGGRLQLAKAAALPSGDIKFQSFIGLTGDFTVTVNGRRGSGSPSTGLAARTTNGTAAIYFTTGGTPQQQIVYGYTCLPGDCGGGQAPNLSETTFRIRRAGSTITVDYRLSGQWEAVSLRSGFTGPATIELFLSQESGITASAASSFDDLQMQAAGTTDLRPSVAGVTIHTAVEVCWDSEVGKDYQVQWTSAVDTNTWQNLGLLFAGTGVRMCTFDSTRSDAKRFYRVLSSQ